MKISEISRGKKRLFLYILLGIIIAYIGYQMISHYTAEEKASVSLNFSASETNIVTKVTADYTMKQGTGKLELSKDFSDASSLPKGCVSSFAALSTTEGEAITKVVLTFEYDEKYLSGDETKLVAVRLSNDLKEFYPAKTTVDTKNNTVTVKTSGEGKWCLAMQ
ncbi:MAG: hypothetical protein IJB70_02945 [Clostridia bacterium]|nr:hypothetical protein [Clostridia bacterium]